jgi:hypothetical protein
METVGLALGIPGLVGLLLQTSLQGYKIFSTARALDEDFGHYQHQFNVQHQKLTDWATTLKQSAGQAESLSDFLNADPQRFQLIVNTLTRMAQLFADVRQLQDLYGAQATVKATVDFSTTTSPKKRSLGRILRRIRPPNRDSPTPPMPTAPLAPIAPPTLTGPNLDLDLSIDETTATAVAESFRSAVSSYAMFKWTFSDKDKLHALIEKLRQYNDDLNDLTLRYLSTCMHCVPSQQSCY